MKKKRFLLAYSMVLYFVFLAHPLEAIQWEDSFDRAFQKASQSGKPVFIDFYTDWCGWCKKLDMEVYTDPSVQQWAGQFVCVKVNCEKDRAAVKRFDIEGFPTLMFLRADGSTVERIDGYVDSGTLVSYMKSVLKKAGPPQKVQSAPQTQLRKAEQFYQLARKMEALGRKPQAIRFYSAAVKLAPGSDLARKAELRMKRLEVE